MSAVMGTGPGTSPGAGADIGAAVPSIPAVPLSWGWWREGMRVPVVALGMAAFLISLAVLSRFYVYPQSLVLPLEQVRAYRLVAASADYLDTATLKVLTGAPVEETVSLYGDPTAGDGRTAVWVEFASLQTAWGQRIDYHERRVAFDRRTGMTVNCCGEYIDSQAGLRQSGLAFRLPYGAQPVTYPMFDPVLKREVQLRFDGTESVDGLDTYRYTYSAGPVKIEDLLEQLPGRLVGLPQFRHVTVSRFSKITRVLWVDPESGLPVRVRELREDTLRTADQVDRQVAFKADLVTQPGDVQGQVEEALAFRRRALVMRDVLPAVLLALGMAMIGLAGMGVVLRRRRRSAPAQDEQQVPGHDLADAG